MASELGASDNSINWKGVSEKEKQRWGREGKRIINSSIIIIIIIIGIRSWLES